uniref:Uncharacterized protein n=1 Tax=Magallana gigas TaxID=29159 RepID=K1P7M0_MAGGI
MLKNNLSCRNRDCTATAVTRIRTWVVAATTRIRRNFTIICDPQKMYKSIGIRLQDLLKLHKLITIFREVGSRWYERLDRRSPTAE